MWYTYVQTTPLCCSARCVFWNNGKKKIQDDTYKLTYLLTYDRLRQKLKILLPPEEPRNKPQIKHTYLTRRNAIELENTQYVRNIWESSWIARSISSSLWKNLKKNSHNTKRTELRKLQKKTFYAPINRWTRMRCITCSFGQWRELFQTKWGRT